MFRILFLIFTLSFSAGLTYAEPHNLSLAKQEVKSYHDSGTYQNELANIIEKADHYISKRVKLNASKQKLAIVLDIDETCLSNYADMINNDFSSNSEQFRQVILKAKTPAIDSMLSLYRHALAKGVEVFFVTGRHQSDMYATKTNLKKAGFSTWQGLYLRPDEYHYSSIIPFKTKSRADITQKGYVIIANIGDQYSDLIGGYAERTFKLPNPYYFLP